MAQRPGHGSLGKTKRASGPKKKSAVAPAKARPAATRTETTSPAKVVPARKATTEPVRKQTKLVAKAGQSTNATARNGKDNPSALDPGAEKRSRATHENKAGAKPESNASAKPRRKATRASSERLPEGANKVAAASKPSVHKKRKAPDYLAAELGQPVDHEGEPIGAGSPRGKNDATLQAYALQLWRNMQSGGVVKRYMRAFERAGLTVDEVWTVGLGGEARSTSSTPDEMRRYKQRLLFRANLLEALLTETIADLHRLEGIVPTPPQLPGDDGSARVNT